MEVEMTLDLDRDRRDRDIVRLHKTGKYTRDEIAKEMGTSKTTVCRILDRKGVLSRLHYRNEGIWRLHREGVSLTDICIQFGMARDHVRDHILTGVSFKAPLDATALRNTQRVCPFCGRVYQSGKRDQILCTKRCVTDRRFVSNSAVYIEIREMRRTGATYKDLAGKYEVSRQRITIICSRDADKNPWADKLTAIETIRRQKGRTWVSGYANLEKTRALKLLEAVGLLDALRHKGII